MLISYIAHLQSNPGWFAINVLVPVLLPFAVIAAVAVATGGWREFKEMVSKAVDNAQLLWIVLSMLAATGYEAFSVFARQSSLNDIAAWTLGVCIIGAVFTSIIIAVNTTRVLQGQATRKRVVWLSILLTVVLCYVHPLLHFMFLEAI